MVETLINCFRGLNGKLDLSGNLKNVNIVMRNKVYVMSSTQELVEIHSMYFTSSKQELVEIHN